jgi:cell division protein FtsB
MAENVNPMVRILTGAMGVLLSAGIIGGVVMYGQMEANQVQIALQEQHIEALDRRVQQCENVIRRRDEAMKQ